jgi:hypothetical protein
VTVRVRLFAILRDRGGVTLKITVTPAREDANQVQWRNYLDLTGTPTDPTRELLLVYPNAADAWGKHNLEAQKATTQPAQADERLRQITEQLDQLKLAVDALRKDLGPQEPANPESSGK